MGLYLCVFDGEEEVEGVEVGSYDDFHWFREQVADNLDASAFPTLLLHSDCDGEWSVAEVEALRAELLGIREQLARLEAFGFHADWQRNIAKLLGLRPGTLAEAFIDVDGEPLLERLIGLCEAALRVGRPILFQ